MKRAAGWLIVLACLWPWTGAPRSSAPLAKRLLGPAAGLSASLTWVRFDLLVREGRYDAAYAAAERALELDPRAPQGWVHFAAHLARFRASPEIEPDPTRRRQWIGAALDLLARGEPVCADPGELARAEAGILLLVAAFETEGPGLDWPGGARAAEEQAAAAMGRAAYPGASIGEFETPEDGHDH
jgi:hypothetical protein